MPLGTLSDELLKPVLRNVHTIAHIFHVVLGAGNWHGLEISLCGLPGVARLRPEEAIRSGRKHVFEPGEKPRLIGQERSIRAINDVGDGTG